MKQPNENSIWNRPVERNGKKFKLSVAEQRIPSVRERLCSWFSSVGNGSKKATPKKRAPNSWEKVSGGIWEEKSVIKKNGDVMLQRRSIAQRKSWFERTVEGTRTHVGNLIKGVFSNEKPSEKRQSAHLPSASLFARLQSIRSELAGVLAIFGIIAVTSRNSISHPEKPQSKDEQIAILVPSGVGTDHIISPGSTTRCPNEVYGEKAKTFGHVKRALKTTGCEIWTGDTSEDNELRRIAYEDLYRRLKGKHSRQKYGDLESSVITVKKGDTFFQIAKKKWGANPATAGLFSAVLEEDFRGFNVDNIEIGDVFAFNAGQETLSGVHHGIEFEIEAPLDESRLDEAGSEEKPRQEEQADYDVEVYEDDQNVDEMSKLLEPPPVDRDVRAVEIEDEMERLADEYYTTLEEVPRSHPWHQLGKAIYETAPLVAELRALSPKTAPFAASIAAQLEAGMQINQQTRRRLATDEFKIANVEVEKVLDIEKRLLELEKERQDIKRDISAETEAIVRKIQ